MWRAPETASTGEAPGAAAASLGRLECVSPRNEHGAGATTPLRASTGSFPPYGEPCTASRFPIPPATMSDTSLRVLSVIPPMTQLNTPYPSTAYLTGFLRSRGVDAVQEDLALALVLHLFSRDGLAAVRAHIEATPERERTPRVQAFLAQFDRYHATIGPVVAFLQGRDRTVSHRICGGSFLPEGPRFDSLDAYIDPEGGDPLAWAFGALGLEDRARHLATL